MVMPVITQFHRSQICHRLNCRQRFGGWERPQMGCNKKSAKCDSTGKYLPVKKKPLIFLGISSQLWGVVAQSKAGDKPGWQIDWHCCVAPLGGIRGSSSSSRLLLDLSAELILLLLLLQPKCRRCVGQIHLLRNAFPHSPFPKFLLRLQPFAFFSKVYCS